MGTGQTHRTQRAVTPRLRAALVLALALLPALACGWLSAGYQFNNPVREAVYRYERDARGKADELVIQFNRTEPRVKFEGQNENGGRTVWLFDLAVKEYFALLPPDRTFLYVQSPQYNADYTQAEVKVYRGSNGSYHGRELTLAHQNNGAWTVTADTELPPN
ncbi:MAG: hypothetical protein FOGNACKC_05663 [Anaerolineae bacterium]|nr:hypothetical protein [Anaerolineae bacterium]